MKTKKTAKPADFAALVTEWQSRLDLSNGEAADLLGVTIDALVRWRGGSSTPPRGKWAEVARVTGHTIEEVAVAIARGVKP